MMTNFAFFEWVQGRKMIKLKSIYIIKYSFYRKFEVFPLMAKVFNENVNFKLDAKTIKGYANFRCYNVLKTEMH